MSLLDLERALDRVAEGNQLAEWIQMGGYPELHTSTIPAEEFYGDYVATYLERDVRQILQVRNCGEAERHRWAQRRAWRRLWPLLAQTLTKRGVPCDKFPS